MDGGRGHGDEVPPLRRIFPEAVLACSVESVQKSSVVGACLVVLSSLGANLGRDSHVRAGTANLRTPRRPVGQGKISSYPHYGHPTLPLPSALPFCCFCSPSCRVLSLLLCLSLRCRCYRCPRVFESCSDRSLKVTRHSLRHEGLVRCRRRRCLHRLCQRCFIQCGGHFSGPGRPSVPPVRPGSHSLMWCKSFTSSDCSLVASANTLHSLTS